jgi:hypothetical protein
MDEQTVDQLTDQEFLRNSYVFQVNDPTLESAMLQRIQPGRLMSAPERPHGTRRDRLEHEPPAHYTIFVDEQFPIHITLSRAMAAPRPQAPPSQWIDRAVCEPDADQHASILVVLAFGDTEVLTWKTDEHGDIYWGTGEDIEEVLFRYWLPIPPIPHSVRQANWTRSVTEIKERLANGEEYEGIVPLQQRMPDPARQYTWRDWFPDPPVEAKHG